MDVITADIPSGVALRCVAETHYEFALAVPSQPLLLRIKAVSGFILTPSSKLDKTAEIILQKWNMSQFSHRECGEIPWEVPR